MGGKEERVRKGCRVVLRRGGGGEEEEEASGKTERDSLFLSLFLDSRDSPCRSPQDPT